MPTLPHRDHTRSGYIRSQHIRSLCAGS